MKRRDLLKRTMLLGIAGLSLPTPRLYAAPFEGYAGRLLVNLQCDGGWDVTSFCDPKPIAMPTTLAPANNGPI